MRDRSGLCAKRRRNFISLVNFKSTRLKLGRIVLEQDFASGCSLIKPCSEIAYKSTESLCDTFVARSVWHLCELMGAYFKV